ncbi:S-layer family protein [Salsuginibacillus halophilus]|uniref:S-layer family protein n=1 Tax=Salsuginibacillus halophilus TaxID=517424 RepID=A0A2P8HQL9_9BACI|nr:S-layer homology domain-containing protein [Salsuginibacillus halophilus]PSL48517.1 S-layer family protein [Salsuginibacillus halophilus]
MLKQMTGLLAGTALYFAFSLPAAAFPDVADDFWGHDEIDYLTETGIITGHSDGRFLPMEDVTREQSVYLIYRALDLEPQNPENLSFQDVPTYNNFDEMLAAAVDAGIYQDDHLFRPDDSLTRAEMAAVITRAYNLTGEPAAEFRDVNSESWEAEYIGYLGHNQLTTGYPDLTFRPDQNITRAEFATFAARAENSEFKQENTIIPQHETAEIYTPYAVGGPSQTFINDVFRDAAIDSVRKFENLQVEDPDISYIGEYSVQMDTPDYLSIVLDDYYTSEVLGSMHWQEGITIDRNEARVMNIGDFFETANYETMLNETLEPMVEERDATGRTDFQFEGFYEDNGDFYIYETGMVIVFPEGALTNASEGVQRFEIPWSAIDGSLN